MIMFLVDLKHQPGELANATEAIARKGINITAFSGLTCGDTGTIALMTNDEAGTRLALSEAGFQARELEAVSATIGHAAGTLTGTARKLADAGINIEVALPTAMAADTVSLAFAVDQPARAREILRGDA